MDRAHRLGQKRVVNVYRLITRGTIEEKIMGLQKFKLNIASSVITQQNNNIETMNTAQLLDLFSPVDRHKKSETEKAPMDVPVGSKAIIENLEELWDTEQYEEEFNLDNFLSEMK